MAYKAVNISPSEWAETARRSPTPDIESTSSREVATMKGAQLGHTMLLFAAADRVMDCGNGCRVVDAGCRCRDATD